jgi:hypothetical protein
MQVFIVGTVLETAKALDSRRLNKQIIECRQIIDAIQGTGKGWFNHPVVKMYEDHTNWLRCYMWCLEEYQNKKSDALMLMHYNNYCEENKPAFFNDDFFTQMKRRLYTKDNEYYKQWADLGESDINWYWSPTENKFIKYVNGKRIN